MSEPSAGIELVIERVFDAPRELVYRAFTDPDQLARWFGPVGFSVPRESVVIEARVGGPNRFTMVSDSDPSQRSSVDARFVEVIENELLVGEEEWVGVAGQGPLLMRLRLEFRDDHGQTRLLLRQGPLPELLEGNARQGWESSFTRLDALLGAA